MSRCSFWQSLQCAVNGIVHTVLNERNFRIHLIALVMVVIAALFTKPSTTEVVWLVFAVTAVLVTEMINTAVERTVDLVTKDQHPLAKVAKDAAAGAVLLAAIQAVIVGLIIFCP